MFKSPIIIAVGKPGSCDPAGNSRLLTKLMIIITSKHLLFYLLHSKWVFLFERNGFKVYTVNLSTNEKDVCSYRILSELLNIYNIRDVTTRFVMYKMVGISLLNDITQAKI